MHKGDYHTDYSKYYDKEYKDKDLAFEHVKKLKQELRKVKEKEESQKACMKSGKKGQKPTFKQEQTTNQEQLYEQEQTIRKIQTPEQETSYEQDQTSKSEEEENQVEEKPIVKKRFYANEWKEKR